MRTKGIATTCLLAAAVAGCAAQPQRTVAKLNTADPAYASEACLHARDVAMLYDDHVAGRIGIGLASALLLGPFGLPIAVAADAAQSNQRAGINEEIERRCRSTGVDAMPAGGVTTCPVVPTAKTGMLSYGWTMGDATVFLDGHEFNVWLHPKEDTLLIQPALHEVSSYNTSKFVPDQLWINVADQLISPAGCLVVQLAPVSRKGATWEATYKCRQGADLRSMIGAQRAALKRGEPLKAVAEASLH